MSHQYSPRSFLRLVPNHLLRSFFAQPEPLKWIVGGAKPFRTGPLPHEGHRVGPEAYTPWITSNRCPHWVQT